jgi:hypothetical protein
MNPVSGARRLDDGLLERGELTAGEVTVSGSVPGEVRSENEDPSRERHRRPDTDPGAGRTLYP